MIDVGTMELCLAAGSQDLYGDQRLKTLAALELGGMDPIDTRAGLHKRVAQSRLLRSGPEQPVRGARSRHRNLSKGPWHEGHRHLRRSHAEQAPAEARVMIMSDAKSRTVPRREQGTVNTGFRVRFVERRYDACGRWYSYDRPRLVSGVPEDRYCLLDREDTVKNQMDRVHTDEYYYGPDSVYLVTCVTPCRTCEPLRGCLF